MKQGKKVINDVLTLKLEIIEQTSARGKPEVYNTWKIIGKRNLLCLQLEFCLNGDYSKMIFPAFSVLFADCCQRIVVVTWHFQCSRLSTRSSPTLSRYGHDRKTSLHHPQEHSRRFESRQT